MLAVTFCDIGWLNVSVKLCVFCSSVFFCEKKNTPTVRERMLESCRGVFSLTEPTDLTEPFAHLSSPQKASGIQISQNVTAYIGCNALWYLSPLINICVLSLFAERLLFVLWNLWEIKHPIDFLRSWKNLTKTHKKALTDIRWYD